MSIATERGDAGQTSLVVGVRVSKADPRVEAYGALDELISRLGFARALCRNAGVCARTKAIQRELFQVGSAVAAPADGPQPEPAIPDEMVGRLTEEVHRIEGIEGLLADWSLPGEDPASAAFDLARTACRRVECLTVRLAEEGFAIHPNVLRYLNRLSDLIWLFGRQIEAEQGIDSCLREGSDEGSRWSRAW